MGNDSGRYRSICQVRCGTEFGNGFLVAPNLVLTADHVIASFFHSGTAVEVCFENEEPDICKVLFPQENPSIPLSVLQLASPREFSVFYVGNGILCEDSLASMRGFPSSGSTTFDIVELKYVRLFDPPISNCNTEFKPLDERRESFKGFSGSPVFVDGYVIGIVLQQSTSNHVANRVRCLCGQEFRDKLHESGIDFRVYDGASQQPQFTQTQVLTVQAASHDLTSEIDMLVDERFQPIKEARMNGNIETGKRELRIFLEQLSSLHCSNSKKAECYYQGAVQLLLDHEADDAENALQAAKAANPELDDSVYHAYEFLQRGLPEQGRECLSPVDSGMKLDAYFSCLIAQKVGLPEFKAVLQATGISPNWQSLRLLAIAALQSGCFEEAHHYVQEAREKDHVDLYLPIVEALIFYWEALYHTYPDVDRTGFAIADNLRFVPDSGQMRSLEQAYQILDELYERNIHFIDSGTRSLLTWALLAVSVALPGKDYLHWLKEFRALRPLDPIGIIFCTNRRIQLSEGICEEFLALPIPEQNAGSHAYARYRLLDALGRHDEARETFSANLAEIASYYGCSSDLCQLQMLVDTKNCHEANKLLKNIQLSGEEKKRFEIAIQFQFAPKAYNQLVKQVVDFARTTQKGIDYGNALTICRFYKKWDDACSIAKEWWNTTGELAALEAYAEALLKKGKHRKCLSAIKKAENAGDATIKLKQHKINALLGLAKMSEARSIARELGDAGANPRLATLEARTFISEGQPQSAIRVLQSYADRDLYDLEVYRLLTELLMGDDPELAFHYAEQMYRNDPENTQVLTFAGNIALMTGHDDSELAGKFILRLQQNPDKGGFGKTVTVKEALEILHEAHDRQVHLENDYKDRKLPIHLFADSIRNNLGSIVCSALNSDTPYLGRFGVSKNVGINFKYPLILDYTSCLVLYKIGLLETVCSWFADVWIDQHLLEIWLNDINQLKSVQVSVEQKSIQLSDTIKSLRFMSSSSQDSTLRLGFNHVLLRCAEDSDAILVSEDSDGNFHGESVPEGWNKIRIHPYALYAALDRLCLPHPNYGDIVPLEESIAKIMPQCSLVLDRFVLDELLLAGALKDVFNIFHVVLPAELVSSIHNQADGYRNRDKTARWLEEAYGIVGELLSQGKVALKPSISSREPNTGVYTQLYLDEFSLASSVQSILLIDDCFGNKYRQIDRQNGNSPIISSYDLMSLAFQAGKLNENEYYQIIDQLLFCGYGFFVPPSKYVFNRLCLSDVDVQGILCENPKLRNLRRMFAYAFDKDIGPRSCPGDTYVWPELVGYIGELGSAFRDCLADVWKSDHTLEWRKAASDWILAFAGDFICDIERFNSTADDSLALKQATLLLVKALQIPSKRMLEFADWIDPYLIASWWANPTFAPKAAKQISKFIQTTLLDGPHTSNEKKVTAEKLSIAYICNIPYLIRPFVIRDLINHPFLAHFDFDEMIQEDEWKISQLGNIQEGIEGSFIFDKARILCGDEEAMDAAACFVLANVQAHSEGFVQEFPIDSMSEVPVQANYTLARFLANLSWYFPPSMRAHLHELKRRLSVAPALEY